MSFLFPVLMIGIFVAVFGGIYLRRRRNQRILTDGDLTVALVLDIHQTGTVINQSPVMALQLRLEQTGQATRELNLRQVIDLGNIPRVGEQVYISVDKKNPNAAVYMGLVAALNSQAGIAASQTQMVADAASISPRLRESKTFGVATIQGMAAGAAPGATVFTLEIDSCVEPKRVVTIEQVMQNNPFRVGDRAYLFVSKEDKNAVAVVPLSLVGGQKIDPNNNRLDALVLGPQILHEGKKAMATVTEADEVKVNNGFLEKRGVQRWHLQFLVKPEDGSMAYAAEQTLSFTNPERVQRVCRIGAEVPIRIDWNDPHTIVTDPLAMGYPDPYVTVMDMYKDALAAGEIEQPK
jgi:hypothetical protein